MTNKKLKITEMGRMTVEEFHKADKLPLVVILDEIRSLYNVGSVFRTADAFRIGGICLCGITAQPPCQEIHKTALGAEDSVGWHYYDDTMQAVEHMREMGYKIISIEQAHGSTMLQDLEIRKDEKYAVIMGNEVKGVRQDVVDASDLCVEIPQYGTKHSMNVSVTTGIVLWEFAHRMW